MSTICTFAAIVAALILLPLIVLLWFTESRDRRAQRLRRYGWTQQRIATHLGCSRSTVRRMLVSA